MAQIPRKHGQVLSDPQYGTYGDENGTNTTGGNAGFFSGYQPLFIKIYDSRNLFTADSISGTGSITPGGRAKAIQAVATFGSILMVDLGDNSDYLTVVVDAASFNSGSSMNDSDYNFGNLSSALYDAVGFEGTISWAVSITANGMLDF